MRDKLELFPRCHELAEQKVYLVNNTNRYWPKVQLALIDSPESSYE